MSILTLNNSALVLGSSFIIPATPGTVWSAWSAAGTYSGTLPDSAMVTWVDPSNLTSTAHSFYLPLSATSTYNVPTAWMSAGNFNPPSMGSAECRDIQLTYRIYYAFRFRTTSQTTQALIHPKIRSNCESISPGVNPIRVQYGLSTSWINATDYYSAVESSNSYVRKLIPYAGVPYIHVKAGPTDSASRTTAYFSATDLQWSASGMVSAGYNY